MNQQLDLIYTTLIAELAERALDAQFDADFDAGGLFKKRTVKGRDYWYFRPSSNGKPDIKEKYVGPADDADIASRIENFSRIKADHKYRQRLVSTLVREARLFRPDQRVAAILETLAKAGLFPCAPVSSGLSRIKPMARSSVTGFPTPPCRPAISTSRNFILFLWR